MTHKHPPTPQHPCAGCGKLIGMHVEQCWRCRTQAVECEACGKSGWVNTDGLCARCAKLSAESNGFGPVA